MAKVKLNELANIYLGVTHTPEYVFEGVPFLSVKDINGGKICFDDCKYISKEEYDSLSEGAKPKIGDMLFCRVGTLGKPIIIPEGTPLFGTFVSLGYLRNRNSDRCDLNYLKYWMYSNSFWKQVNANVKGASQVNLNTGWLSKFDIDLPGIAEQRYRISVLDKCKSVIEKREAELAALDNLIKARFVEMFGDPRSNPFGFEKKRLKDTCKVITGNTPSRAIEEYYGDYIEWIKTDNIVSGILNPTQATESLSEKGMNVGRTVEKDSILMACIAGSIASIGRVCITDRTVAFNQQINAVVPEQYNILFLYVLFQMSKDYLVEDINMALKGILSKSKLEEKEFIIPPMDLQEQFSDFVKQVDKSKVAVQKALDETQMLFDSLMQEYFG